MTSLYKKGLVLAIIALFIGAGVVPSVSGDIDGKKGIETTVITSETGDNSVVSSANVDWWPKFHHNLRNSGYSSSDAPDTNDFRWINAEQNNIEIDDAQSIIGPIPPENYDKGLKSSFTQQVISNVPSYIWRHGCGPTAAGMVIGYYDGHGYNNLVPGDASSQTNSVNQMIASGGDSSNPNPPGSEKHYEDYARPEDSYPNLLPDDYITQGRTPHASNSLADFMKTSRSTAGNYYGWSWFSDVDNSLTGYVSWATSYGITTTQKTWGALTWSNYKAEIDADRPVVFLVDTDGNGNTDHFVTGIGYDDATNEYGCYNTWDHSVHWYDFTEISPSNPWGIYGATFCQLSGGDLSASASANPTTILVGGTVQFTGSATGGNLPYTWDWDFGDGTAHSNQQNPIHQYNSAGFFTATLTVTDVSSHTDTDTVEITVNHELSCDANGPYSGTIGNPVTFSGTATGGHSPYSYSWNFGDGGTSTNQNPTHQYNNDGNYTATLTVTDSNSDTASDTASVTIYTAPLFVAEAHGPYTGTVGIPIEFEGGAYGGKEPYSWYWDFGDGIGTSTEQNPSYAYTEEGEYIATLTVTDDNGDTDDDTADVTVYSDNLNADANGPYFGTPGVAVEFEGGAYGGTPPYSFEWNFGDGIGSSTEQNPSYTYAEEGVYTVILTATDDGGLTDSDDTMAYIGSDPDLDCSGTLSWINITPGDTVTGSFTVQNVGSAGSLLDWEVSECPTWGTWTFTPSSGDDLTSEAGSVTVSVSVVAPDEKDESFSGTVKIVNKEDISDYCTVMVSLVTPKVRVFNIVDWFMEFLDNHPHLFPLLRQL
jgi:PKD repeat protein